jgi:hypothetical protein
MVGIAVGEAVILGPSVDLRVKRMILQELTMRAGAAG